MAEGSSLRAAGRTRGVQDNRGILFFHRGGCQRNVHPVKGRQRGCGGLKNFAPHRTVLHRHRRSSLLRQTSARKGEEHLRATIFKVILQLRARQQGVERHTNRPARGNTVVEGRHQRHVRHGQRHPVARFHTQGPQIPLHLGRCGSQFAIADAQQRGRIGGITRHRQRERNLARGGRGRLRQN